MHVFEIVLVFLTGAVCLSLLAHRWNVPYPTLLALGGMTIALIPGTPTLDLPPDLILALFVAPVLLDAAHGTSLRDLRRSWRPILSLVVVAVGLTTLTVALVAKSLLPDMPLAAALALGALLAPPDAVAAIAVLRHVSPPRKLGIVLEGESLLNDASSLLIYKLAVASVVAGSFSAVGALPSFFLLSVGSVVVGWILARVMLSVIRTIHDAPAATIIQFISAFGVWIFAERLGLSGVVTIVVFGLTAARRQTLSSRSHIRVFSNSTWKAATFVLNVLAFLLIGLQLRPIIQALPMMQKWHLVGISLVLLVVVIVVRLAWVLIYGLARSQFDPEQGQKEELRKERLLVGWSGMRGIVTLAAALALPPQFPYREFILLAAFIVVLGTLIIQGLTLGPLLKWLELPEDHSAHEELAIARTAALEAALREVEHDQSAAATRLRLECQEALTKSRGGLDPHDSSDNILRQRVVPASRRALDELRNSGAIGDEAYRAVEQELDLLELSSRPSN